MTAGRTGAASAKSVPAYRMVAAELRGLVVGGGFQPGDRLPGEAELCERYAVSRSTVREAIRTLEAQHLVVTTRGTTGGTFVAEPEPRRLEGDLHAALGLLAAAERVTVAQIVEIRQLLEAPAAALAAVRRTADQLADLRELVDHDDRELFHLSLLESAGNELIGALTRPLLAVLDDRLARDHTPVGFDALVDAQHRRILTAVDAGDAEAAEEAMRGHLASLAEVYSSLDRGGDYASSTPSDASASSPPKRQDRTITADAAGSSGSR
jgi:DNA-binding FadR family transcriptional regulator